MRCSVVLFEVWFKQVASTECVASPRPRRHALSSIAHVGMFRFIHRMLLLCYGRCATVRLIYRGLHPIAPTSLSMVDTYAEMCVDLHIEIRLLSHDCAAAAAETLHSRSSRGRSRQPAADADRASQRTLQQETCLPKTVGTADF